MSLFTLIGRVQDGLLLAGSQTNTHELSDLKRQAKRIMKNIKSTQPKVSIDAGNYMFHYLISYDIVYLVLVESSYNTGLAFSYLQELNEQFYQRYGDSMYQFDSAWACVSFANEISKLQAEFINPNSTKNMKRITEELNQVQDIIKENLSDIMSRGQSLEKIFQDSDKVRDQSMGFKKKAKWINTQAALQQYAIPLACISVVLLIIMFRYWFTS
mmetsp:Transcript_36553/g.60143  ORF Transcript_36553/g.60143 Transcript_36553/m.60143 type:complete len:214 (+) Transcript_36553:30-671(+)